MILSTNLTVKMTKPASHRYNMVGGKIVLKTKGVGASGILEFYLGELRILSFYYVSVGEDRTCPVLVVG